MPDILPSSVAREIRGRVFRGSQAWIPIFCLNCGCDGGMLVEPEVGSGWAGYLCDPCAEKWSPMFGTCLVPDEVFQERAQQEQMERYGRLLAPNEVVEALKDGSNSLAKLVRSR